MKTFIALLRGINVGGHHRLPMKELVRDLAALGYENVRTYIQSGNVVFSSEPGRSASLAHDIEELVEHKHGFRPKVLILTKEEFTRAVAGNPFSEFDDAAKTVHLLFLAERPRAPDLERLEDARAPDERFHLAGEVFYLHSPSGLARSKLATKAERFLGVAATARNWRTITRLLEIVAEHEDA